MQTSVATIRKMIASADGAANMPLQNLAVLLDVAVGKVARELFDVAAEMNDISVKGAASADILQSAPKPGLLFVFGLDNGLRSAVFLDAILVNGIVEIATGASETAVFRDPRAPTAIDAALCRDFAENMIAGLSRELAEEAALTGLTSARLLRHETDVGRLAFEFGAKKYTLLTASARLQDGIRGGGLSLALPVDIWNANPNPDVATDQGVWHTDLVENVLCAPLPLRADVETIRLPLGKALLLSVGDTLALSPQALSRISLKTDRNVTMLNGRLGQSNGKKAVLVRAKEGHAAQPIPENPSQAGPDPLVNPVPDGIIAAEHSDSDLAFEADPLPGLGN